MFKRAVITVRIDDICPWNDIEKVQEAVSAVESCGVRGLLGVVPACADPDLRKNDFNPHFWEWLRGMKDRGWSVALHGYAHHLDSDGKSLITSGTKSEFAGKPYGTQFELLEKGKRILTEHELETDIFFAPAHSFDSVTLEALKEAGFRYVSDGRSMHCYIRKGIKHISCRSYGMPKHPRGIVTLALHPCEDKPLKPWLDYIERWRQSLVDFSSLLDSPCRNILGPLEEKAFLAWRSSLKPGLQKMSDSFADCCDSGNH